MQGQVMCVFYATARVYGLADCNSRPDIKVPDIKVPAGVFASEVTVQSRVSQDSTSSYRDLNDLCTFGTLVGQTVNNDERNGDYGTSQFAVEID